MTEEKNSQWDMVEAVTESKNAPSQKEISHSMSIDPKLVREPEGVIENFRHNKITQQAGLAIVKEWYNSQLEVAKHQLKKAVVLKTREADVDAEKFLAKINQRHLVFLRDLETSNLDERFGALEGLGDQTSAMLKKLIEKDWPESMRNQMIDGVSELQKRFFEKIMTE